MDSQLRQEHSRPHTADGLHRSSHRLPTGDGVPPTGSMGQNSNSVQTISEPQCSNSKIVVQPVGPPDLMSRLDILRTTLAQAHPITSKQLLEKQEKLIPNHSSYTNMQGSNPVVDIQPECNERSTLDTSTTTTHHIHRQLEQWLGRNTREPNCIRNMDTSIHTGTHQSERDGCRGGDIEILQVIHPKQIDHDSLGQLQHGELSEQVRRDKVTIPTRQNSGYSLVVQGSQHNSQGSPHPRQIQCDLGSTVPPGTDNLHRVVHPSQCNQPDSSNMGKTTHRHVCHSVQCQTEPVLFTSTRSKSPGSRRSSSILGKHNRVCVPPTGSTSASTEQNKSGKLHHLPRRTSLELKKLVPQSSQPSNRSPKTSKPIKKTVKTAHQQRLSPKSCSTKSTRVEIVQKHLLAKGFSKPSAKSISQRCRQATNQLYEARWRLYVSWCNKRKINPIQITEQQLADFFHYLSHDLNKGISALQGYRAVINSTIQLCTQKAICNNYYLQSQLRSYKNSIEKEVKHIPKWNLTLVLNSLTKAPYEPMLKASLKHLSWKTAFLVAFATAARVGELRALAHDQVAHDRHWSKVTLQTHALFIAKNQDLAVDCSPRKFEIPALFDFAGPDLPDRLLCPVRSLRYYLEKTRKLRTKQKKALFVSYDARKTTDITTNTLANWIKNVIKLAYQDVPEEECTLAKVTAHEVRALASSVAFKHNLSLPNINQACYWRGHSTFSNYYLRDVALYKNDEMIMPNMVAAAKKITK